MNIQFNKVILLSIAAYIITLLSCKSQINQEIEKNEVKNKQLQIINKGAVQKLFEKHHAIIGYDTMFRYTSELQDFIKSSNRPIGLIGQISDIVKKDSSFILEVAVNERGSPLDASISEISIDSLQFQEFKKHINDDLTYNEVAFVIHVKKVGKSHITGKDELNEDYIHFEGDIIDYYIFIIKTEPIFFIQQHEISEAENISSLPT